MALIVGENTYMSTADIQSFWDARGVDVDVDDEVVLRAMDYFSSLTWVVDFEMDNAPENIKMALCYAVKMEAKKPGILTPTVSRATSSVSVGGAISIKYEPGRTAPEFPIIESLLKGFVQGSNFIRIGLM